MRRFHLAGLLILTAVLFFQCQKEVSYIGGPDPVIVTPEPITANLQGNVYDENEQPAVGVTIKVGAQSAVTDSKGYFRITNASLDKKAALVTAEKPGYFKAYRSFSATSGTNQVTIKLVKRILAGTINSTSGGDVTLSNGTKVALPANGVVNAVTGADYTGDIKVFAAYIDPTAPDISRTVPGSFMANDINGSRVTLVSYGMVAVELESTSGEKLQIKQGNKATLTTFIPNAMQASAPSSIPLWYVDEQTGIWKEEGSATRNGSVYTGEVSHFSFWNCDVGVPGIHLSMTLHNSAGLPLVHALVKLTRTNTSNNWAQSYGYTDSLGQVSGLVPANELLMMEVMDACWQPFYSQNIGPFTQNTNLGVITLTNTGTSVVTIQGTILDCNSAPVTSGYAMILYGNMIRYAAVNAQGFFEKTIIVCNSNTTYQIIGVDANTNQQGATTTGTVTVPTTNVGNLTACGISTLQYINYTLDGTSFAINNTAGDSIMAFTGALQGTAILQTLISGNSFSGNHIAFRFNHPTQATGTYQAVMINANNVVGGNSTTPIPVNIVVTAYPQVVGEFYEGTFSGNFVDQQSVTHTINGTFRVRKNF